jgi:uridine kinase
VPTRIRPAATGRQPTPSTWPPRTAPADAVLLVDGVFLLRPELNDAWDLRGFLQVPFGEALPRALERDRARFGSAQATRDRYRQRYLATVRPRRIAEVVVDNRDPAAPRILTVRRPRPG